MNNTIFTFLLFNMQLIITKNKKNNNLTNKYKLVPIDKDLYRVLVYDNNNLFGYYNSRFYNNNFAEYLNDCYGVSDIIEVVSIKDI